MRDANFWINRCVFKLLLRSGLEVVTAGEVVRKSDTGMQVCGGSCWQACEDSARVGKNGGDELVDERARRAWIT